MTICDWISQAKVAVPPALVYAIIQEESGGQPGIISPTGAVGLMQIEAKYYLETKLADPIVNIKLGCSILLRFYRYTNETDKVDWSDKDKARRALASYYAGPGNVKGIPEPNWPPQTAEYADNIWALFGEGYCG